MIHSSFTTGSFEVVSPCAEYSETWLCNSSALTPKIHEEIKSISGVFRFRLHKSGVPFQTTLGVTDRSCITFCISDSKLDIVSGLLESIYQHLRTEVTGLGKQELQRIPPLVWSGSKCAVPVFFQHQYIAFLDFRRYTKQPHSTIQNKIQDVLISMDIPYCFQKRSILVLYASGILLETFRQAIFHENIILPFGREEGCFQCNFAPNRLQDSWHVELQTIGSTQYATDNETNNPYIIVRAYEGQCVSEHYPTVPPTPQLARLRARHAYEHGILDGSFGQMISFATSYKSSFRLEAPAWHKVAEGVAHQEDDQSMTAPLPMAKPVLPMREQSPEPSDNTLAAANTAPDQEVEEDDTDDETYLAPTGQGIFSCKGRRKPTQSAVWAISMSRSQSGS